MATVDLHIHSTASDGEHPPAEVVRRAAAQGLRVIALTDHDTLAGVEEASAAGRRLGVRVIPGCEFSVAADWGEMHLLGYFLPPDAAALNAFLADQREKRFRRGADIVRRLNALGTRVSMDDVLAQANGGSVGRPHVARALVAFGAVPSVPVAFERYLAPGRPAFVPKQLPPAATVAELIRAVGGVSSAAHLKDRGVNAVLRDLRDLGVDAVEVLHPSHAPSAMRRIERAAGRVGLLLTGGSDWHGDDRVDTDRGALGAPEVPEAWVEALEVVHRGRLRQKAAPA